MKRVPCQEKTRQEIRALYEQDIDGGKSIGPHLIDTFTDFIPPYPLSLVIESSLYY
jgi:hypothetical protein